VNHALTPRAMRALAAALLAVLLSGLAFGCTAPEGGMYQGGSDSEPGWRR
jgi:hypothetical protein